MFLCCFLGRHWGCKDKIGWRTACDALEGSEVLVPVLKVLGEGWTHGCAIRAAVLKRQDFVINLQFNRLPVELMENESDVI